MKRRYWELEHEGRHREIMDGIKNLFDLIQSKG
jgi:hypothetical protein